MIVEKIAHELVVEIVPGAGDFEVPPQPVTSHRDVAHEVQNLVTDHLIGKAQPFRIDHPVIVENDSILQGTAKRQAILLQPLDILHETKRPGTGDAMRERQRRGLEGKILGADVGMGKTDTVVNFQPVERLGHNPLSFLLENKGALDLGDLAGTIKDSDPGGVDQVHIYGGTAVKDGDLLSINFDQDIVYLQADKSGQEMFDSGDLGPFGAQSRGQAGADHLSGLGHNNVATILGQQRKNDACISRRWFEHHLDLLAAVQTDAGTTNFFA